MNIFHPSAFEGLSRAEGMRVRNLVPVAAAPAALAVLEIFHPHPHHLLALDVRTWLVVHYLQVPLFALSAFAVARLVRTQAGFPARLCQTAMFVFALCFLVFDTAAGLVVGCLVQAAQASRTPGVWLTPIYFVWTHPILGGVDRPLLALIGRVALSIGTVSAAISLHRAGRPLLPLLLLALSGCVMYVFPGHSWPGGPLTFGGLAMAAAWVQWSRPRFVRSQHKASSKRFAWAGRQALPEQREVAGASFRDHAASEQRPNARDFAGPEGALRGGSAVRRQGDGRPREGGGG